MVPIILARRTGRPAVSSLGRPSRASNKEFDMKRFAIVSALLVAGMLTGCTQRCGCGDSPQAEKASGVVTRALDVTGGKDVWTKIDTLEGTMLLKVYGPGEAPYVTRVRYTMHPRAGKIHASAPTGEGEWTASVNTQGQGSFSTDGPLGDGITADGLKKTLGEVVHRIAGAGNIAWGAEKPYTVTDERIDGIAVDCVGVRWTESQMRRYCFGRDSGRLRFAIAGATRAGMDGTITIYRDYTKQTNDMILPLHLRQVEIGEYVLLGDTPRWDVQLLSVTMR
jgi:hypothetical protein